MNKYITGIITPKQILATIEDDNIRLFGKEPGKLKEYTFFILGKSGPTGKSWLTEQLISRGYSAFELSEDVMKFVKYNDNKNHYSVNDFTNQVVIVLNKTLEEKTYATLA